MEGFAFLIEDTSYLSSWFRYCRSKKPKSSKPLLFTDTVTFQFTTNSKTVNRGKCSVKNKQKMEVLLPSKNFQFRNNYLYMYLYYNYLGFDCRAECSKSATATTTTTTTTTTTVTIPNTKTTPTTTTTTLGPCVVTSGPALGIKLFFY